MKIELQHTSLDGVLQASVPLIRDERGGFGRVFCTEHWPKLSDFGSIKQVNQSINRHKGTLRGLHFQREPHAESKLVMCVRGSVFDVVVDLREGSSTYGEHISLELHADQGGAVVIPKGCAHGFQTLEDHSQLLYFHDQMYTPSSEGGLAALDPALAIRWPLPPQCMSERDLGLPKLEEYAPLRIAMKQTDESDAP